MAVTLMNAHVGAALLAALLAGCSPNKKNPDPMSKPASQEFDCARAAQLTGHEGAQVNDCKELLPDLFRVVLTGGPFPDGHFEVVPVLWEDGAPVEDRGYQALARYLERVRIYENGTADAFAFQVLLDHLQATPPGFRGEHLSTTHQDAPAGVSLDPFALTLVAVGYQPPPDAAPDAPTPPAGAPTPPEGPPGGPPAAMAPPPGMGPPGGGAPGGAAAPQALGRATLRGDADYRFTWTVEMRDPYAESWSTVRTEQLH